MYGSTRATMEHTLTGVVPRLADQGVFGPGRFLSLRMDDSVNSTTAVQYSSEVTMLKLKLRVDGGDSRTVPIVLKTQFSNEKFRRRKDCASMFRNEVAMYQEILPFLSTSGSQSHPSIYYGLATGGEDFEKDVLILNNIKYAGYTQCKEKQYLDVNHIEIAIKKLAELHSWSFIEKTRNRDKFFELVSKLTKVVRVRGDEDFDFYKMNYLSIKRGINPLVKTEKEASILKDFVKIAGNTEKLIDISQKAVEPFGVVVHGDYCKNNMLFKYDYKGKPTDCAYFDFQLSKYGSPVVDLSFFLYIHTTSEIRENYWDEFLQLYWTCVRDYVPDEICLPSYEDFKDHFGIKAIYGYVVGSFYLPNCLEDNVITNEEFLKLSPKGKLERFVNSASEKGQQCISEIVRHMLRNGYFNKFLKYYQEN